MIVATSYLFSDLIVLSVHDEEHDEFGQRSNYCQKIAQKVVVAEAFYDFRRDRSNTVMTYESDHYMKENWTGSANMVPFGEVLAFLSSSSEVLKDMPTSKHHKHSYSKCTFDADKGVFSFHGRKWMLRQNWNLMKLIEKTGCMLRSWDSPEILRKSADLQLAKALTFFMFNQFKEWLKAWKHESAFLTQRKI